jgi:hypothetical protein
MHEEWLRSICGMTLTCGNEITRKGPVRVPHLFATNTTQTELSSKPGLHVVRTANNRLSHNMALVKCVSNKQWLFYWTWRRKTEIFHRRVQSQTNDKSRYKHRAKIDTGWCLLLAPVPMDSTSNRKSPHRLVYNSNCIYTSNNV